MKKWTYETCYEEAKNYKELKEFRKKSNVAYGVALKNNWLDNYVWLKRHCKPNGYWTKERCFEEAKKYSMLNKFRYGSPGAFDSAWTNRWVKDYTWFEDERFNVYTDKVDSVYSYEFEEQKAVYVGRTLMKLQTERDHQHIFGVDSVSSFAKSNDVPVPEMKILEDSLTLKEGSEREGYWVEKYRSEGWTILNVAKTGSIGAIGKGKWNHRTCEKAANEVSSRVELFRKYPRAYKVSLRNGWLDEFFPKNK